MAQRATSFGPKPSLFVLVCLIILFCCFGFSSKKEKPCLFPKGHFLFFCLNSLVHSLFLCLSLVYFVFFFFSFFLFFLSLGSHSFCLLSRLAFSCFLYLLLFLSLVSLLFSFLCFFAFFVLVLLSCLLHQC